MTSVEIVFQISAKFMEETVENVYKMEVKNVEIFINGASVALRLENIFCFII